MRVHDHQTARSPSGTPTPHPYFEDFAVGRVHSGGKRRVTEDDLRVFAQISGDHHPLHTDPGRAAEIGYGAQVMHGPFGQAAFLGWLFETGLSQRTTAMLDSRWEYLEPVLPGDEIGFEMTVTGKSRSRSRRQGVVDRYVEMTNQHGTVLQRGSTAAMVAARTDGSGEDLTGLQYCTAGWAERLGGLLQEDPVFQRATATWDGTIGLASDGAHVALRIYRGAVIATGTRVPNGPTFTVKAADKTWVDLLCGQENDFMRRVMKGQFSTQGSAYEYLRLIKTIKTVVGCARQLAEEAQS